MQRYYIPALGNLCASLDRYTLPMLRMGLGIILIRARLPEILRLVRRDGLNAMRRRFESSVITPGMFWVTLVGGHRDDRRALLVFGLFTRSGGSRGRDLHDLRDPFDLGQGFLLDARRMEYSILILLAALVFLIRGGGEYSVDNRWAKSFDTG